MKNLILVICIFVLNNVRAQDKPRKFNKPVVICPIDYGILTTSGITSSNLISTIQVKTYTIQLVEGNSIPRNAIFIDGSKSVQVTDTIFKYSLIAAQDIVFDVIQNIGSFSLIKIWDFKTNDTSKAQLTENDVANFINNGNNSITIPKQMKGIRKLTAPEKQLLKKNISFDSSLDYQVDPSKDFYLIKTDDINSKSADFEFKKNSWNIGLMYLPIKIRPFATKSGLFDFYSDLSIGTSFSWTICQNIKNDWTTNLLIYTGVSSIKVDSLISGGDTAFFKGPLNITAFSPAIGLFWEKKGIQFGFAIGMDFLTRSLQKTWVYQGMPWLSLTAGLNIFNLTNKSSNAKGAN